jgi:hypothetical protein
LERERESGERRVESEEQQVESRKWRAKSGEWRAESGEQGAESREQRWRAVADSREPRAETGAESQEPIVESGEQRRKEGNTHGKQGSPNKIIGLSVLQDVIKGDHGDDASKNAQHWKNESEGWYAWIRCCEDGIEDNQNWDLTSVKSIQKKSEKLGKKRKFLGEENSYKNFGKNFRHITQK